MKRLLIALALASGSAVAQIPPGGVIGPGQTVVIGAGAEVHYTGTVFVAGGRLEVNGGKLFLDGSLWITQGGAVLFDGAEFHHQGSDTHIIVGALTPSGGNGSLTFRNGSRLHFEQTYVSQHELHGRNGSTISLERTRIDCDAATGVVRLFGTASYGASESTAAPDPAQGLPGCWMTTYMNDASRLSFDSVNTTGDIVFYDAAQIVARGSTGVMPWLFFPGGAVADLSFPPSPCDQTACPPVSKTIDSSTVPGIQWSVRIEDSYAVAWGINSYAGSQVTVRDSELAMALVRLSDNDGNGYLIIGDFVNDTLYKDKTFSSLPDRTLHLVNTKVKWWKVDAIDHAQARIDSIVFAEMVAKNWARALVTNSICQGQTIHLGALDNSYLYFKDGEVWTHVSAWNQALLVLDGTLVDYTKAPVPHQIRNIAHDHARLYAINSWFRQLPEAMGSALVTFAALGKFDEPVLKATAATPTPVAGSAWIDTQPQSGITFAGWALAIRRLPGGGWSNFAGGKNEVHEAQLATVPGVFIPVPGSYELRLTLLVSGDDAPLARQTWMFPALKKLVVE